jgi:hypothetical protein
VTSFTIGETKPQDQEGTISEFRRTASLAEDESCRARQSADVGIIPFPMNFYGILVIRREAEGKLLRPHGRSTIRTKKEGRVILLQVPGDETIFQSLLL